jgi:hypothetical protein
VATTIVAPPLLSLAYRDITCEPTVVDTDDLDTPTHIG